MFLPELRKQQEQEKRLACLRAQIDKAKATLDHRTRELGWLANDPGYIEVLAREKLEKMKQGETIFRPASP
jgi:cell division protein FtsB